MEEVLSSPQFQSALSTFHSGLASGQLGPLMSQFGLGEGVTQSAASGSKNSVGKPSKSERGLCKLIGPPHTHTQSAVCGAGIIAGQTEALLGYRN